MLNNIDGMEETILTYNNLDIEEISLLYQPAPYVADKLEEHKDKIFNEFLRLIGISNMAIQKKERMIKSEVAMLQGGSIASRYNRYESRVKAIEEINKKFNTNIEVEFYDGVPSMLQNQETQEIEEGDNYVI